MSSMVGSLILWDKRMAAPDLVGQTEVVVGLIVSWMLAALVHHEVNIRNTLKIHLCKYSLFDLFIFMQFLCIQI